MKVTNKGNNPDPRIDNEELRQEKMKQKLLAQIYRSTIYSEK
jgi:hypothetical protein